MPKIRSSVKLGQDLTPLETQIIERLARGYTLEEIKEQLGLSSHQVVTQHLQEAKRRAGAGSTVQLVAGWWRQHPFPHPQPQVSLTSQEREAIYLLLAGRTMGQIGEEIGLDVSAVTRRFERVRKKTGTRNRLDLLCWFLWHESQG